MRRNSLDMKMAILKELPRHPIMTQLMYRCMINHHELKRMVFELMKADLVREETTGTRKFYFVTPLGEKMHRQYQVVVDAIKKGEPPEKEKDVDWEPEYR